MITKNPMTNNYFFNKLSKLPNSFFFVFGVLIALITLLSEWFLFDGTISNPTLISLFNSINWFFFPLISQRYLVQKHFLFLFTNILFLCFTMPIVLIKFVTDTMAVQSPQLFRSVMVYYFLGIPLSNLLSIFGYNTSVSGDTILFENLETNVFTALSISSGCSGLYSTLIFSI